MIVEIHPVIMDDGYENYGLVKHYSDKGMMMKQIETGDTYGEAVDVYPCPFTYAETDIPINPEQFDELEDAINALKLLGVSE